VAHWFRAAARLYRARPWRVFPSDGFIRVACDFLGMEAGALCVVGQVGESFGFVLFRKVEEAAAFIKLADQLEAGRQPAVPQHMVFRYDSREEAGPVLAREIEVHGWEIADPRAVPGIVVVDEERVTRWLTRSELVGVTAVMEALADLIDAEPELAGAWGEGRPCERLSEVPTALGAITVEIGAPLWLPEEAPLEIDQEDARMASLLGVDGSIDEELLQRYRAAILERFARSPEATPEHLDCAEMLVEYAARYQGSTIAELPPAALNALLFETIPRKVSVEADAAPEIIEAVKALLGFAARELDSGAASRCLASLQSDAAQRLARALDEPRNFGPAKALLMEGARAGYDVGSRAGLEAWMAETQRRMLSAHAAAPAARAMQPPRARPSAAKTRTKRKAARKARKKTRRR
jgi:hypothetical protein